MRILAIDPGSMLGWATDAMGRLEWGTEDFRIKGGESSGNRWRRFGAWLWHATMPPNHPDHPEDVEPTVSIIVYERAHFMPKARAAAEIAAGFTTRLEEHCERYGISLQPVAVQTLKAFALSRVKRKKGDPKMDRSKAAMIMAAVKRLDEDGVIGQAICAGNVGEVVKVKTLGYMTEHEADALWLYWWAKENCK